MNREEATLWAKIRDAHAMAAEAINDYLNEAHTPTYQKGETAKPESKGVIVNLENIDWIAGGETDKGPYQKSASKPTDFYAAKKAIEEKGRPLYMDGYVVWYMDREDVLARRKK